MACLSPCWRGHRGGQCQYFVCFVGAAGKAGTPDLAYLALVISVDNLSGGIASTAFVAYLSSLANRSYTATQYALFSSLMTLPGKFISGFSGMWVDSFGYSTFLIAAVLGLPAILLVMILMRHERRIKAAIPGGILRVTAQHSS